MWSLSQGLVQNGVPMTCGVVWQETDSNGGMGIGFDRTGKTRAIWDLMQEESCLAEHT